MIRYTPQDYKYVLKLHIWFLSFAVFSETGYKIFFSSTHYHPIERKHYEPTCLLEPNCTVMLTLLSYHVFTGHMAVVIWKSYHIYVAAVILTLWMNASV